MIDTITLAVGFAALIFIAWRMMMAYDARFQAVTDTLTVISDKIAAGGQTAQIAALEATIAAKDQDAIDTAAALKAQADAIVAGLGG